jgi:hypothetical protein
VTVGLYGGPAGSAESALTLAGTTTIVPGAPGFFNGGLVSIQGLAGGANAALQVRAWSGAASYAAAVVTPGASAGKSALWTQRTGGPVPNPPTAITAGLGGGLNAPIVLSVSSPSHPLGARAGGRWNILCRTQAETELKIESVSEPSDRASPFVVLRDGTNSLSSWLKSSRILQTLRS